MNDSQAAIDIHRHMLTKLSRLLRDISSACQIADIDDNETIHILMSALLQQLVKGSAYLDMNETDFVRLCRLAYRTVQQQNLKNSQP